MPWLVFSLFVEPLCSERATAQDVNIQNAIEELSAKQWTSLITRTSHALLGNPISSIELQDLLNAPPQARQKQLHQSMVSWLQSDAFAKQQAIDWCRDYFLEPFEEPNAGEISDSNSPWDYTPHDRWLVEAVRTNMPFDSFFSYQLSGVAHQGSNGAAPQPLATASWYRAHQFQVADYKKRTARNSNSPPTSLPTLQPFKSFRENTHLGLSDLVLGGSSWLHHETPVFRMNQFRALSQAIASIRESEIKDWERLEHGDAVRSWYEKQTAHHMPPRSERIFVWPSIDQQISLRDDAGHRVTQSPLKVGSGGFADTLHSDIEEPLRRSQEWTIVLNGNFSRDLITSSKSAPQRILTQQTRSREAHATDDTTSRHVSNRNELRLEINNGYLLVSLVHDDPISMIQVQTTEPIAVDNWTQIAVSYDGTNRAHSLRISLDGQYVGVNHLADSLIRDFVGEASKVPAEGRNYELQLGNSTNSGHFWELEDIEVYRTVLSIPELLALIGNAPWMLWQDFSESERLSWIEHYARRIDPEWRYERETLRYYLSNEYMIWESIPLTPILPAPPHLVQLRPNRSPITHNRQEDNHQPVRIPQENQAPHLALFPWKLMNTKSVTQWNAAIETEELKWDTLAAPWEDSLSRAEVTRQLKHLIERIAPKTNATSSQPSHETQPSSLQAYDRRFTEPRLQSLAKGFIDRNWDRQSMMLDLLQSPEWIAIALDLVE